jgi:hypothetical protein
MRLPEIAAMAAAGHTPAGTGQTLAGPVFRNDPHFALQY